HRRALTSPPPTRISTLSLHDALPICVRRRAVIELEAARRARDRVRLDQVQVDIARRIPSEADLHIAEADRRQVDPDGHIRADRKDRKSTRLNSSHGSISYAVFCLKKK